MDKLEHIISAIQTQDTFKICDKIFKYPIINFLDIETTGFNRESDYIIDIGILKINTKASTVDSFFESKISIPENFKISKEVYNLTGISEDALKGAPDIKTVLNEVLQFVKEGEPIVLHNSTFDISFLNTKIQTELGSSLDLYSRNIIYDTVPIAKNYFIKGKLDQLADQFLIEHDDKHGALPDCYKLWKVLVMLQNVEIAINNVLFLPRCPECGGFLVERTNSYTGSKFVGCNNFPFCTYPRKNK